MSLEALVFRDKNYRTQLLIEGQEADPNLNYLVFPFTNPDGSPHPLFLELETLEEVDEITDVSIVLYQCNQ